MEHHRPKKDLGGNEPAQPPRARHGEDVDQAVPAGSTSPDQAADQSALDDAAADAVDASGEEPFDGPDDPGTGDELLDVGGDDDSFDAGFEDLSASLPDLTAMPGSDDVAPQEPFDEMSAMALPNVDDGALPDSSAWSDFSNQLGFDPNSLIGLSPHEPPGGPRDLVERFDEPAVIEQLPYVPGLDDGRIQLLGQSADDTSRGGDAGSPDDLDPRSGGMLSPTDDGGPPLARPIVLVSLSDEAQGRILEEALAAAAARDAATAGEIAEEKVSYAFWLRACEDRALLGDY